MPIGERRRGMSHEETSIRTPDGECPAYVFTPPGDDPRPAVIFYMDGLGIRPTIFEMAQRLAEHGFVVLVPDMFYRVGPYEPMNPKEVFASGDVMGSIGHLFSSTDNRRAGQDTEAFLAYLDTRDDVAGSKVGTTGYCMGGGMSLTAAGTYPDRIAAAASFHGGNLATDSEMSPHRLGQPNCRPCLRRRRRQGRLVPARDGKSARASSQRRRRGSPLRDLSRSAARLDDGRLPRLQRSGSRTPLGRASSPLRRHAHVGSGTAAFLVTPSESSRDTMMPLPSICLSEARRLRSWCVR